MPSSRCCARRCGSHRAAPCWSGLPTSRVHRATRSPTPSGCRRFGWRWARRRPRASRSAQGPPSTREFLRAWAQLPFLARLRQEWRELAEEHEKWAGSPYPPVFVTVDAVVRVADHVLLIRRGRAPGKGMLAVPGGFIEQRETVYQSALRELEEETGMKLFPQDMQADLRAVRVFDHPDRSPRGRV